MDPLGTRDRPPSTVTVADVIHGPLFTCSPEDDVDTVLEVMKAHAIDPTKVVRLALERKTAEMRTDGA